MKLSCMPLPIPMISIFGFLASLAGAQEIDFLGYEKPEDRRAQEGFLRIAPQVFPLGNQPVVLRPAFQEDGGSPWDFSLSLIARYDVVLNTNLAKQGTTLTGDTGPFAPLQGIGYGDIFSGGAGFSMEPALMTAIGSQWDIGGYAAVGVDVFFGKGGIEGQVPRSDEPTLTVSAKAEDQACFSMLLGPRIRFHVASTFSLQAGVGAGIVLYQSESITASIPANAYGTGSPSENPTFNVFNGGSRFAFEGNLRGSLQVSTIFADLGLTYRFMEHPDVVGSSPFGGVTPTSLQTLRVELGITIPF